jgi:hypothetical protein
MLHWVADPLRLRVTDVVVRQHGDAVIEHNVSPKGIDRSFQNRATRPPQRAVAVDTIKRSVCRCEGVRIRGVWLCGIGFTCSFSKRTPGQHQ